STTASHDWDQAFKDAGSPSPPAGPGDFSNGVARNRPPTSSHPQSGRFADDTVGGNHPTTFTGGGPKDIARIQAGPSPSPTGSTQGKDDIENAFAALYQASNGDEILYVGATRFDNSGDASLGFWFFKNTISVNPDGTFSGTHSDGDLLIVANFT